MRRFAVDFQEVEYLHRDGEARLARVCQPQGDGPFPALLYVHGGQWSRGDRYNNTWVYEPLAERGLVVVAVDFRLAPRHPYPEPMADINYATRWLKAHAAEFGADPEAVGGLGLSSGGHQLMLSAMRPHDPRYETLALPAAPEAEATLAYVVACWSILDPYARYLFAQDTGRQDIVASTEGYFGSVEAMHEGNPQLALDRGEPVELPPTLIVQGTEDRNVTPDMQRRFADAYRKAGGRCELEIVPDMPHGTTVWPEPQQGQIHDRIRRFIAQELAAVGRGRARL